MAAMDHQPVNDEVAVGIQHCIWCHELWPCRTARVRRELAERIRRQPVGETGDASWDNGREAGRESAADAIDI